MSYLAKSRKSFPLLQPLHTVLGEPDWKFIYNSQKPELFTKLVETWPAISDHAKCWRNPDNFTNRPQIECMVPVETGSYLREADKQAVHIKFHDLIHYFKDRSASISQSNLIPDKPPQIYLAQHDLREIPTLIEDVSPPPIIVTTTGKGHVYRVNIWLGGVDGTSSNCHYDPFNNMLCQIFGSKNVILFPPEAEEFLYPALGTVQKNTSLVNFEDPDQQLFPQFKNCPGGLSVTLEAGDALFIPKKWWHYCAAQSSSCSVNYWWL